MVAIIPVFIGTPTNLSTPINLFRVYQFAASEMRGAFEFSNTIFMNQFRFWLVLIFSAMAFLLPAQELLELGGLSVEGCTYTDPHSVRKLSGLKIGQRLSWPSQVNQALNKLAKQGLFKSLSISELERKGEVIFLSITVEEHPRLESWSIQGLSLKQQRKLEPMLKAHLKRGAPWSSHKEQVLTSALEKYWQQEGRRNTDIQFSWKNTNRLIIQLKPGPRYRIHKLSFQGQQGFSERKLKKQLSSATLLQKWMPPLYNPEVINSDKDALTTLFQEAGFLDTKITFSEQSDEEMANRVHLTFKINAGQQYTHGPIRFKGNTLFSDDYLLTVLDIKEGDPFNPVKLEEQLHHSTNGKDISGLYLDNGYLFAQVEPDWEWLDGQRIGLNIKITEGKQATIGAVNIEGNERTHETVIRRELVTRPGSPFSRAAILESQRRLMSMGYFNPEALNVDTEVNPNDGTVDLTYEVDEKRGDKWELSASWDPQSNRLIGTVGLHYQNFSIRELIKGGRWDPLPSGDGQLLSFRFQSTGSQYQGVNFNYSEPWLGGKKPNLFTIAGYHQRYTNGLNTSDAGFGSLTISGGSLTLGKRIKIGNLPVAFSIALSYQHIDQNNYQEISLDNGGTISSGRFNNLYLKPQLNYSTLNHAFFPTKGWSAEVSAQFTLPYQMLGITPQSDESFRWLSYHKWRLKTQGVKSLGSKLILAGKLNMGIMGGFDGTTPPFERFELGGNGAGSLQAAFLGNDIIAMRGYGENDFSVTARGGGGAFTKVTAELRYPFLNSGNMGGYLLAFAEAGNVWSSIDKIRPFDLRPTAGIGFRLQLPMIGIIGLDYGIGFDQPGFNSKPWYSNGRLNLILGFEPE